MFFDDVFLSLSLQWQDYFFNDTKLHTHQTKSLEEIVSGKLSSLFIKTYNSRSTYIHKIGDILMGLYLDKDFKKSLEVDILINEYPISKISICPGEKKLSFENASFIPLISIPNLDIRFEIDHDPDQYLYIIYGDIQDNYRSFLAKEICIYNIPLSFRSQYTINKSIIIYIHNFPLILLDHQNLILDSILEDYTYIILPDIYKATHINYYWLTYSKNTREHLNTFKKELIEKTCHPLRLFNWIDDSGLYTEISSHKKYQITKIWYDEILIIDTITKPSYNFLKVLYFGNIKKTITFINSNGRNFITIRGKKNRFIAFDISKPYWIQIENKRKINE